MDRFAVYLGVSGFFGSMGLVLLIGGLADNILRFNLFLPGAIFISLSIGFLALSQKTERGGKGK